MAGYGQYDNLNSEVSSMSNEELKKYVDTNLHSIIGQAARQELEKRKASGVSPVSQAERTKFEEEKKALSAEKTRAGDVKNTLEQNIKYGESQFAPGSLGRLQQGAGQVSTELGRVDTELGRLQTAIGSGRESDIQQVIDERRKLLGGLSDQETNIMRSRAEKEIARNEESQRRRLQAVQNITGVRGGTAASQQLQVLQQGQAQRTAFEQNLILANRDAQTQALGAFEQSIFGAEQANLQRTGLRLQAEQTNLAQQARERELQQFNLGQELQSRQLEQANAQQMLATQQFNLSQAAREKFAGIALGSGLTGMQLNKEANLQAQETQRAAIEAASAQGKTGGGALGLGGDIPVLGGLFKL